MLTAFAAPEDDILGLLLENLPGCSFGNIRILYPKRCIPSVDDHFILFFCANQFNREILGITEGITLDLKCLACFLSNSVRCALSHMATWLHSAGMQRLSSKPA